MIFSVAAFALFVVCLVLFKAVRVLPTYELKRRVKAGDNGLQSIYRAQSYGATLDVVIWLAAAGLLSWSAAAIFETSPWAVVLIIFLATFLAAFMKLPPGTSGPLWLIAKGAARPAGAVAGFIYPLSSAFLKKPSSAKKQGTAVFEKQDLINLVKTQKGLPGNRISDKDLQVVAAALNFSGKSVSEIMTTGAKLCFVSGNEPIGPLLMDELHSRGRFAYLVTKGPVKKHNSKPVGTVFVRDLVGHHASGQVKDVAQEQVYYINESQPVSDALEAMLKTQFPILAVVNSFEEISGVVSLEDIIKQLLPDFMSSDFENYANPKAAAGWQREKSAN